MEDNSSTTDGVGGQKRNPKKDFSQLVKIVESPQAEKKSSTVDEIRQKQSEQRLKDRETRREGEARFYGLRDDWSKYIFWFVSGMIVFEILLTFLIGTGKLDFTKHQTFLYIVIAENFAQIVGMGYIVANYLFPKSKNDGA